MSKAQSFTPREIVSELDRYIVGQNKAKRAVAVALRNRFRRQRVPAELRDEIAPEEHHHDRAYRRGQDRDCAPPCQAGAGAVREGRGHQVHRGGLRGPRRRVHHPRPGRAGHRPGARANKSRRCGPGPRVPPRTSWCACWHAPCGSDEPETVPQSFGPFSFNVPKQRTEPVIPEAELNDWRKRLRSGELDERLVDVDVEEKGGMPLLSIFGGPGMGGPGMDDLERKMGDMLGQLPGAKGKAKKRSVRVVEARKILEDQEAERLVDMDKVKRLAVERSEQSGIVFLDEIDKIASRSGCAGGRRLARGRAARPAADRRGQHRHHQVRRGQDRPHPIHRGRRVPRLQGPGPDPRAAGALPRARRARVAHARGLRAHPHRAQKRPDPPVPGAAGDRGHRADLHRRCRRPRWPSTPPRPTIAPKTSVLGACTPFSRRCSRTSASVPAR